MQTQTTATQLAAQADHYERELDGPFCPLGFISQEEARHLLGEARQDIDAGRLAEARSALDRVWFMLND